MSVPLIETRELRKYFQTKYGLLHAVDGINLSINVGETLGVVGESGCGKSTLGRTVLRLIEPTSGEILLSGKNIEKEKGRKFDEIRAQMQIVFQDPFSSLNPRMSVSDIIAEPMKVNHTFKTNGEMYDRVFELMETVGLAERFVNSYPHELDGGRRQRIGVARALALNPRFIVCDEPVSALDVSIQAQILNLFMDIQDQMGISYMFITHDLSVVKHISNNILVMYMGCSAELAPSNDIFAHPLHPYTQALLKSIPIPNIRKKKALEAISGEITSPIDPKPGCRFAARCPHVTDKCTKGDIPFKEVETGHFVACTLY